MNSFQCLTMIIMTAVGIDLEQLLSLLVGHSGTERATLSLVMCRIAFYLLKPLTAVVIHWKESKEEVKHLFRKS